MKIRFILFTVTVINVLEQVKEKKTISVAHSVVQDL